MSKHTPGPWWHAAKLTASENHKGFVIGGGNGWRLADLIPVDEDGEEGLANARLIAAAPELLEAVNRLLPHLEQLAMPDGRADADEAFARAAIAKAEGNQ